MSETMIDGVALTDEEINAAVVAAADAKRASLAQSETASQQAEAEALAREERISSPLQYVGLDLGGGISYIKLKDAAPSRDRCVTVDGRTYEHVSDDADGIWIYRHLG